MDGLKFEKLKSIFNSLERQNRQSNLYPASDFSAVLFFFRLRLIKYEFLEKGKKLKFGTELLKLILRTGAGSTYKFWKNEGRYLGKSGENHKHYAKLTTPHFAGAYQPQLSPDQG